MSFKVKTPVKLHPAPYIFCTSQMPKTRPNLENLKKAINEDYDAWYSIKDPQALGHELEKAINRWIFDQQIKRHSLYKLHGLVHYYEGDKPPVIADLEHGMSEEFIHLRGLMKLWFIKQAKFSNDREYRFAYIVESSELSTLPEYIDTDLTVRAIRMFEKL